MAIKNPYVSILCLTALLPVLASACLPALQVAQARSELPRRQAPVVTAADQDALRAGNTTFALDVYQAIRSQPGNLFYSPYSLSAALAMTSAGAAGDTLSQMEPTLSFQLPQDRLHPAFNALEQTILSAPRLSGDKGQAFQLEVVNAAWAQKDYSFLPAYLDTLAESYGAGLYLLDFPADPDSARQTINRWVSDQTKDKIKDLLPAGVIDALTRLVLTNAIYFKADWLHPFDANNTRDQPFNRLDGSQVTTPSMAYSDVPNLGYFQGSGFQAVDLPYVGGQVAMTLIVPDLGQFSAAESSLDPTLLEEIIASLEPTAVELHLPSFEFESELSLAGTLAAMGMPDAFDPDRADFSRMDGTRQLYISHVLHKAFVAVDEKGTEAAAATAVIMRLTGMRVDTVVLTVDRPFIFLIRHIPSGAILFLGRVVDPSSADGLTRSPDSRP